MKSTTTADVAAFWCRCEAMWNPQNHLVRKALIDQQIAVHFELLGSGTLDVSSIMLLVVKNCQSSCRAFCAQFKSFTPRNMTSREGCQFLNVQRKQCLNINNFALTSTYDVNLKPYIRFQVF